MQNTVLIQTEKTFDRDSLIIASLIVTDVKRLIRCIRAIAAILVRYATIAVSISNSLRRCIESDASMQQRRQAQRIEVSLQNISVAKLPLAG